MKKKKFFVVCAETLEDLLWKELEDMGFSSLSLGFRGVYVLGDIRDVCRVNYCSRIASRVLWPIADFLCEDKRTLYKKAREIPWQSYMGIGDSFAVQSNVNHKSLRNGLFAAQVVKDAICDSFRSFLGKRPNVEVRKPDVRFHLFIDGPKACVSLDTSGDPLFKRGYRRESVDAPLQETLAAALLLLSGYKGDEVFFDPCCGSGVLPIEAAMIASKTPPGYLRKKWGFFHLPDFSMRDWISLKNEVDSQKKELAHSKIFAVDIDGEAVRICKNNLKIAGFDKVVQADRANCLEYIPPVSPSMIVCNPPYGRRLGDEKDLSFFYKELGFLMRKISKRPGKGFILTSNINLAKSIYLKASRRHIIKNSGIECRFLAYDFIPRCELPQSKVVYK